MMHFTVDVAQAQASNCITCCCEKLSLKPGTTSKVSVGYAPWAVPIGQLHCDPQFQVDELETCLTPASGAPVPANPVRFDIVPDTSFIGDMTTLVTDPDSDPLTFKALALYGPQHGILDLDADGTFTYTPASGYTGGDRFFASVSDGTHTVVFEVLLAIGVAAATVKGTWDIVIGKPTVDQRYFTVSFPVTVSPAAKECKVWRLTVLQGALDCECTCFTRSDCFDISVAKC